ncbi:MAG: HD domain-containing protein [Acidobacteria bacterium]|nr:HD domain-containing protein [Acidobacteriota bacterium]
MNRLPPLRTLTPDTTGWGYFLCTGKEARPGRNGEFLSLTLQDATGRIAARVFDDVENQKGEFDAGEFVKVQGRANTYNGRLQLVVERIRRVHVEQDRAQGFREEELVMSAPRPLDEMWAELVALVTSVQEPFVRALLERITREHEAKLRIWPAAQLVHHAYRGGFLEHILQIARVASQLADAYQANRDVVIAGAVLHDIGKLQELNYEASTSYSREGNLLGHIALGVVMVREAGRSIPEFPPALLTEIEHVVLSHHGSFEFGSPVEPMTVEAFILSMADDLDAKIHQVRAAIAEDTGDGEFTGYLQRLGRVIYKGGKTPLRLP